MVLEVTKGRLSDHLISIRAWLVQRHNPRRLVAIFYSGSTTCLTTSITHKRIRAFTNRGAYREATNYAATLPSEVTSSPSIALEIARNFLKQGYPLNAESALVAANVEHATPGERLILTLEKAALHVYSRAEIREAVAAAAAAFAVVNSSMITGPARIDHAS